MNTKVGLSLGGPAAAYRKWHDQQGLATDEVRQTNNDLLTLTTSISSRPIATESLTVRIQDFRPVGRTVSMRDAESIEIAEVHYDVLDGTRSTMRYRQRNIVGRFGTEITRSHRVLSHQGPGISDFEQVSPDRFNDK